MNEDMFFVSDIKLNGSAFDHNKNRSNEVAYKLVIFDLDGTLIDSLADITDSFNEALRKCGRKPLSIEQVRSMIGRGVLSFLRQALGEDTPPETFEAVHKYFVEHYAGNLSNKTIYYPGIPDMLRAIDGGRQMAVLSNKNTEFIQPVLQKLGMDSYFSIYLGGNNPYGKKPLPDAVRVIMEQCGAKPSETIIIGDMPVDIHTARSAGIACCAVFWGYGDHNDLIANKPDHTAYSPADIISIV